MLFLFFFVCVLYSVLHFVQDNHSLQLTKHDVDEYSIKAVMAKREEQSNAY
jgi:hypothetical protein